MKLKLLGSIVIGSMLLAGCQGGSNKDKTEGDQSSQQPSAGQQMPGEMQQPQDIEVSDKEIQKFVDAAQKVQQLNMQMQQEVGKTVKDEGMKAQRFNEIHRAQQSQQGGKAGATEKEMQKYQNILEQLQQKQSGAQEKMRSAIQEAGLTMQRYQQIATAAQQDSTLMKRLQDAMRKGMMQQQQPQGRQ